MKKILLIHLPQIYNGKRRYAAWLPLGLAYIASHLIKDGYQVDILDIDVMMYTDEEVLSIIQKKNFDCVGISAMSPEFKYVKWISTHIKSKANSPLIILGGALAMHSSEIVLKNTKVDICVMGEGEIILPNILKTIEKSNADNYFEQLKTVKGITFMKNGIYIRTTNETQLKDIDSIELPAWNLFSIESYLKTPFFFEPEYPNSMNVITARGCPWNCYFCSKTFNGVRLRSIDKIIEEISILRKKYNVTQIQFAEELVMISESRMLELCGKIKPLNISWMCQGRVNCITPSLLKKMKEAGCVYVGYGIESGSQRILDNMNKKSTVELNKYAIQETLNAGMKPIVQMMFGYPGEDENSIKETREFCKSLHVEPTSGFAVTTPLPGTKLYEWAKEQGLISDELNYLMGLEGVNDLYLNCTDFNNEEFIKKLRRLENDIRNDINKYRLLHPRRMMEDIKTKFKMVYYATKKHGLKKTMKKAVQIIKNNPKIITSS
ncbi:cobalamin-dependent protein [Candidatus Woesearchaeota archaeon]|nr:cobalamin-dependent protein [Candidatus Woesearchaeota archaeon]